MPTMTSPSVRVRRQAVAVCLFAALTVLLCGALITAAVLLHPPLVVLPLIVLVGSGCPLAAGCELPKALAALRAARVTRRARREADGQAVAALRRDLEGLPETPHPLGL
jgi:hypothetical protein